MSGHTPGKWRVCTLAHPEDRTVVVYGPSFSDPVATGIARAGIDASEAHANARLIAAAPEMLDALRVLTAFAAAKTCGVTPEEWALLVKTGDGIPRVVAEARAAIANAVKS